MILPLHILVALVSVALSTITFLRPSPRKLRASAALVALTLISGTYLVMSTHAPLVQSCVTGLVYLLGVSVALAGASYKLIRVRADK
jgi:hypothetical protein